MRIQIVALNYAPELTGSGQTIAARAAYLARAGHQVDVVAGFPHYPEWRVHGSYRRRPYQSEVIDGVQVLRCWHHVPSRSYSAGRALIEASFGLTALAAHRLPKPDVTLGSMPILSNGLAAWLIAKRHRVPFGLFVQDLSARAAKQSGMRGAEVLAGPAEQVEAFLARRADRIAIIAEGFRAPLLDYGARPESLQRVPNFTLVSPPSIPRAEVRARLGWPQDRPVVLHSGNMGYKQALEHLVEAARIAQEAGSPVEFVLVGDGNQRVLLQDLVARHQLSNVRFMPLQDEAIFPSMLGAADVLVLSQRATVTDMSLPGKLSTYLASGRPVVAALHEASETARELRRAGADCIVEPDDPPALLAAIDALLGDSDRAAAMGERGQRFALDEFAPSRIEAALDGFIKGLVASPLA
ncbi:MAG: glycosyltransferase [Actinomycetia bacterium]|nr:glycosyltransferase [Actinomycetes bacterium]